MTYLSLGCSKVESNARLFHPPPIITAINLFNAFLLKSLTELIYFDCIFIDYHSTNVLTPVISTLPI